MATINGMIGGDYFSDSPVVIDISGLQWADSSGQSASPFHVVRLEVWYGGAKVGDYKADTGGQSSISFDISSALKAIWAGYGFENEVSAANSSGSSTRAFRSYSLKLFTEYLDSQDGSFVETSAGEFNGGSCAIGKFTEFERYRSSSGDISVLEHHNTRNGDASTKPQSTPERVGRDSITSWVDLDGSGTTSHFYSSGTQYSDSDTRPHAPLVIRDAIPYTDFIFVNRRGAVETCSAQTKETMSVDVDTKQYGLVKRPQFAPDRTLTATAKGGRRSWLMSSGSQTRDWAIWWATEFLMARRWWMKFDGAYVPVTVEPAKKQTDIYDRAKQQMPHVDFTVTMALEG